MQLFTCSACKQSKEMECFSKDSGKTSGVRSRCKECINSSAKGGRKHSDRVMKNTAYASSAYASNRRWSADNREKYLAHKAVYRAISSGLIVKLPCFICGEKAEAHHVDYKLPLEVIWLCRSHHREAHAICKTNG